MRTGYSPDYEPDGEVKSGLQTSGYYAIAKRRAMPLDIWMATEMQVPAAGVPAYLSFFVSRFRFGVHEIA